jgi:hypothetical protein
MDSSVSNRPGRDRFEASGSALHGSYNRILVGGYN